MQRNKMRKIVGIVRTTDKGLVTRVERAGLTKALRDTYNEMTAKRLTARFLRGIVAALALLAFMACAPGKRTTTYTPKAPAAGGFLITNGANRELLHITADGKTWTWSGTPEEVILELIAHAAKLEQKLAPKPVAAPAKPVAKKK